MTINNYIFDLTESDRFNKLTLDEQLQALKGAVDIYEQNASVR